MMFEFKTLLAVTLAGLFGISSYALESGRYFQAITTSGVINKTLWYEQGGDKVEIYANSTLRSIDYEYDLTQRIVFYGDRTNAEGLPVPEAIATLPYSAEELAAKADRLMLIFHKIANNPTENPSYNVLVIEDKLESFPLGSFKFINFIDSSIAVMLGQENFIINEKKEKVIEIAAPDIGDLTIKLASLNEDGNWENFYSNGWGHSNDLRTIVFLTKSTNGLRPLRFRQYDR